jgi:dolichol-phosphate mannosyltransferase
MVRRAAIAGAEMSPLGYKILIEVLGRGRIRTVAEVGYVFRERLAGESKVTARLYVDYLRHLVRLRLATLPARFPRFAAVGLSGVGVDMALLFLLSDPRMLGWALTPGKVLAAEAAIVNNFLWNDSWTFRDLARQLGGGAARLKRFIRFNLICAMGLALSVLLLSVQVDVLGVNRYLANAVAIALVTTWNFWMNKAFSWAPPAARPALGAPLARRRAAVP